LGLNSPQRNIIYVQVLGQVGYCPQFDALMDNLTGRELLFVYAGIKGVPTARASVLIESLIERVGLSAHASNKTSGYSGGNKRKLSMVGSFVFPQPAIISHRENRQSL
jgi:ABC-type multidrug transport system ATPase subunit